MGRGNVIVAVAAGLFGSLFFTVLANFYGFGGPWCSGDEVLATCRREWVGALSGWVAAVAAGGTIAVLMMQLHQQRIQTKIAAGDADPTARFSIIPGDKTVTEMFSNRLRIENWNKCPVRISKIALKDAPDLELRNIKRTEHPFDDRQTLAAEMAWGEVVIDGWTDRGGPPPHLDFDLFIINIGDGKWTGHRELSLDVRAQIMGARYREVPLTVTCPNARYL
ncbi:hypothetical protein [Chelativorans sp. YIM 93263]|uniref:hypothetical protein n=1 Tax=Chelativorans sp. YIM 93263 TaxID=2906648 RepID=UPI002379D403|nr:hypothetical protein [Chelativorans sp. YIM 93263]